jgi:competence protein ComEA
VIWKSRPNSVAPVCAAFCALSSGKKVLVKVSGDVRYPGIYETSANSLAVNVIKMASPLRPLSQIKFDPAVTNPLTSGTVLNLNERPDSSYLVIAGKMTVPECLVLKLPLDITTMSEADFDRLPGIGPTLARRIVEYRHNNGGRLRVEDLNAVDGIGEKKYSMISKYFQHTVIK